MPEPAHIHDSRSSTRPLRIASWVREVDDAYFAGLMQRRPVLQLENARTAPVDLEEMSGLLLTGGPDISAEFLREPYADLSVIRDPEPERDAWEFTALRRALDRGLPIFCICKGVQVLNVGLGGTLLPDIKGHDLPELKLQNEQPLRYAGGVRQRYEKVNSSHHQALDCLASALEVQAWSAADGIVEQVRIRDYPWGMGVQYHPERDATYYGPLFDEFFDAVIFQNDGTRLTPSSAAGTHDPMRA